MRHRITLSLFAFLILAAGSWQASAAPAKLNGLNIDTSIFETIACKQPYSSDGCPRYRRRSPNPPQYFGEKPKCIPCPSKG